MKNTDEAISEDENTGNPVFRDTDDDGVASVDNVDSRGRSCAENTTR